MNEHEISAPSGGDSGGAGRASVPASYAVGDYYCENGREGVVFEVDASGRHGKIVGMKQSSEWLPWCADEERCGIAADACDMADGMKNMQAVMRIGGWRAKYPAFAWCAAQGDGWYLPAIGELSLFAADDTVYEAVARTLSLHGGDAMLDRGEDEWYWASSEHEMPECAWSLHMYGGDPYDCSKYDANLVRAVCAF